ncbi:hypothetical protein C8F01DRAFT_1130151 [Mycena amicta]|nr:hypothetical protein C8F01DRAFT_1130151 [Mycena amicta]
MAPYQATRARVAQRVPISPQAILPVELWDAVLQEDISDDELLSIATVCHLFHAISIPIALKHSGLTRSVFADEHLRLTPCILRTLHLSLATFAVRSLDVHLEADTIHRDLVLLRDLVLASKNLQNLQLRLGCDILAPAMPSGQVGILTDILAALVERTSGATAVLTDQNIFSCRPEHVASWNLLAIGGQFSPDITPLSDIQRKQKVFYDDDSSCFRQTEAIVFNGERRYVNAVRSLCSVSVDCAATIGDDRPLSLITLNMAEIASITLNSVDSDAVFGVLAHACLPALTAVYVYLKDDFITLPFTDFLLRHPTVQRLHFSDSFRFIKPQIQISNDAVDSENENAGAELFPPLQHPGIYKLHAECLGTQGHIPSGLASLATSPNLRELGYYLPCSPSPALLVHFTDELRVMSTLMQNVSLSLSFSSPRPLVGLPPLQLTPAGEKSTGNDNRRAWYQDPAVLAIVPTLQCVGNLSLSLNSIAEARAMLDWIEVLPALASLDIRVCRPETTVRLMQPPYGVGDDAGEEAVKRRERDALEAGEFKEEVRAKLGLGINVDVTIF